MNKPDLNNSETIAKLIRTFYGKVRRDEVLGPFFNGTIQSEEAWEEHYRLLTAFWELNLLDTPGFNGNPALAHHHVDKSFRNAITTAHFERWVALWTETINQSYEGDMAQKAIRRAGNMAKGMYKKILDQRPGGFILPGNASDLKFG